MGCSRGKIGNRVWFVRDNLSDPLAPIAVDSADRRLQVAHPLRYIQQKPQKIHCDLVETNPETAS